MAIFDNLFGAPPEYLTGLLGADEAEKLRKQAMTTGLVNSAIALIAQPRNQRFGSALPYIGRALMAGQQAGQGVYSSALQGLETQQKLAEFKRKQEQQQKLQEMIGGITDPNERLFAQLAPEQYVTGKLKPRERKTATVGNVVVDIDTGKPIYTGQPEPKAGTTLNKLLSERAELAQQNPNDPNLRFYDDAIRKETTKSEGINVTYGAPVAGVDAQGNPIFFQPTKSGGAPAIIPGVAPPPKEEKASEGERKAATLLSRLQGSLTQLQQATEKAPGAKKPILAAEMLKGLPFGVGETAANIITPENRQQVEAAQLDILDAGLTLNTGAAYTKEQLQGLRKSYFPQIGDSTQTILDKQQRLNTLIESAKIAAGGAGKQQIMPKNEQMPGFKIRKVK